MSGILSMVSRLARGGTSGGRTRRPTGGPSTGRAPHTRGTGRGNTAGLEGMARKLIRRAR